MGILVSIVVWVVSLVVAWSFGRRAGMRAAQNEWFKHWLSRYDATSLAVGAWPNTKVAQA